MITDLQVIQNWAKYYDCSITNLCKEAKMATVTYYRRKQRPETLTYKELKNFNEALKRIKKQAEKKERQA